MANQVTINYNTGSDSSLTVWMDGDHATAGIVLDALIGSIGGQPVKSIVIEPNVEPPREDKPKALSIETTIDGSITVLEQVERHLDAMEGQRRELTTFLRTRPDVQDMTVAQAIAEGVVVL